MFGDLRRFEPGEGAFICEFFDLRAAARAYTQLEVAEGIVNVSPYFGKDGIASQGPSPVKEAQPKEKYTPSWSTRDTQLVTSGKRTRQG
ncbi:hypothetical protein DSO57_1039233 [Entomophthora muscae]|uniref:Uncharacterized protein n=1 Tax=Entomophthora muscae TaxID=34485 RepID=A0ACC2U8B7_9FUNG|nr:hypothetical protein DSO57_1039233 [Entomophthora muscae]